ncbi:MAG: DMT family transporter [Rhodobacter sp.]|nr:DMT family transporter [Rhodobacter sp.]
MNHDCATDDQPIVEPACVSGRGRVGSRLGLLVDSAADDRCVRISRRLGKRRGALHCSNLPRAAGLGEWMGLGSGITFAVGATFAHKVKGSYEVEKTWLSFVFGAGIAAIFIVVNPVYPAPDADQLLAVVPFATAAALFILIPITWAMVWGAQRLDPGRVSLLLMFEVIAASVSASLWAGEPYGGEKLVGTAIILSAGALDALGSIARFSRRRPRGESAGISRKVASD